MEPQGGFITRVNLARDYRLSLASLNKVLLEIETELGFKTKGKRTFSPEEHARVLELLGHPSRD